MILGRFNFLTVRKDKFSVIFTPRSGCIITVVATNLPREDAIEIMDGLNAQLQGEEDDDEDERVHQKAGSV